MCDTHDGRAVCWRCSDAVAWWAEARGGPITCNCQGEMPDRREEADLAVWQELTGIELVILEILGKNAGGVPLPEQLLSEVGNLQRRGLAGTNERGWWQLGIKGDAVLADYQRTKRIEKAMLELAKATA